MTTLQKTLIVTVVTASVVTLLVVQHQTQVKLRAENQTLREQIDQLAQTAKDSERLSNPVAPVNDPQPLPTDQFHELLRLRGEVGVLRRETDEIRKLKEENRRLRNAIVQGGRFGPPAPKPPMKPDEIIPAGSIKWFGIDVIQALQLYAEIANTEVDVDEQVWRQRVSVLAFTNNQAVTRSELIRLLEGVFHDQAGVETTHPTANLTVFKLRNQK